MKDPDRKRLRELWDYWQLRKEFPECTAWPGSFTEELLRTVDRLLLLEASTKLYLVSEGGAK